MLCQLKQEPGEDVYLFDKQEFPAVIPCIQKDFSNVILNHSAKGSLLRMGNIARTQENPLEGREGL